MTTNEMAMISAGLDATYKALEKPKEKPIYPPEPQYNCVLCGSPAYLYLCHQCAHAALHFRPKDNVSSFVLQLLDFIGERKAALDLEEKELNDFQRGAE